MRKAVKELFWYSAFINKVIWLKLTHAFDIHCLPFLTARAPDLYHQTMYSHDYKGARGRPSTNERYVEIPKLALRRRRLGSKEKVCSTRSNVHGEETIWNWLHSWLQNILEDAYLFLCPLWSWQRFSHQHCWNYYAMSLVVSDYNYRNDFDPPQPLYGPFQGENPQSTLVFFSNSLHTWFILVSRGQ